MLLGSFCPHAILYTRDLTPLPGNQAAYPLPGSRDSPLLRPPPQFPQQPFCQGSDLMEKWPSRPVQMPNGHLPITQAMPWFHVETHTPPGMWKA